MKCNVRYLLSGLFFLFIAAGFIFMLKTGIWTKGIALGELGAGFSIFVAILYFKNTFKR